MLLANPGLRLNASVALNASPVIAAGSYRSPRIPSDSWSTIPPRHCRPVWHSLPTRSYVIGFAACCSSTYR